MTDLPGHLANPDDPSFSYQEFSLLHENCSEYGLPAPADVVVERRSVEVDEGRVVSGLVWGEGPPEVVLVHGGAQNAHTWDTVVMAMRPVPMVAVDMPGHGHSGWRDDGRYDPRSSAADVARFVEEHAPSASVLVGMSLGGLTVTALAASRPGLFERLVVVDVTPGVNRDKASDVHAFIEGPQSFPTFGEIFARTLEFNPTRTPESLRRGILHNAHRLSDGSWEWRYDRRRFDVTEYDYSVAHVDLWDDVSATELPYLLLRGGTSPVVDDDDVAELLRRRPDAVVEVVEGAGHSIQGDKPLELAVRLQAELDAC